MKFGTTTALALVLAIGGTAIGGGTALAKDKKAEAAKGPDFNLSKPVRDQVVIAQKALTAGDTAAASAAITAGQAAAKSDDDRYVLSSVLFDLSKRTNDKAQQNQALEGMLVGNRLPADQRNIILLSLGQDALQAGNYPKADQLLTQAVQSNPADNNAYALLAETKMKAGKPAESVAVFQQAMDHAKASNTKLPADFYGRAINIAYTAKLPKQTEMLTQSWIRDYPTKDNWRDSIVTWRDLNKPDADLDLDFMRLLRAVGAMKGQGDYLEYVNATYVRLPAEAKSVLDEGVKAGFVNLSANKDAAQINGLVSGKTASDKASLAASATTAKGAKGTAKIAVNTADGYASYGDYATAIPLYQLALQKGGVDPNLINTRIAVAMAKSGDKAGAKTVFGQITGPRASLATYWTLWLDGATAA